MTRNELRAKAVAYEASKAPRFYKDLNEPHLSRFWAEVARLRYGPRDLIAACLEAFAGTFSKRQPSEAERLREHFWADQRSEIAS